MSDLNSSNLKLMISFLGLINKKEEAINLTNLYFA